MSEQMPAMPLPPPDLDALRGFPESLLAKGAEVWRVCQAGRGPWYFGNQGRFGLDFPEGTCYVSKDPLTAILEVMKGQTRLRPCDLDGFAIWHIALVCSFRLANLQDVRVASFGLNRNFSAGDDYSVTRQWARAFWQIGLRGVQYWSKRDVSDSGVCFALFGEGGERDWKGGESESLNRERWRSLIEKCGIVFEDLPADESLEFSDPPNEDG